MRKFVLKDKAETRYCPHCGAELEKDITRLFPTCFKLHYECSNFCDLPWEEQYQTVEDETDTFLYYEEELT